MLSGVAGQWEANQTVRKIVREWGRLIVSLDPEAPKRVPKITVKEVVHQSEALVPLLRAMRREGNETGKLKLFTLPQVEFQFHGLYLATVFSNSF
jgi:hypothetical protein